MAATASTARVRRRLTRHSRSGYTVASAAAHSPRSGRRSSRRAGACRGRWHHRGTSQRCTA
eukprot:3793484-Prymnesium_polylepis.1